MSVLLMTATINSGYFGNISSHITDTEIRRKQYEDALEKYILYSNFNKIVFADNSNEKLNEQYFLELAQKSNKKLEFLEIPGDMQLMKKRGKSYGEAALIRNAFLKSELISCEDSIYKVTGRIWIQNINKIIDNKHQNCFIAHNFKEWVLTSFFKITKEDLLHALAGAPELCNDNTENNIWCIEHVYYELLRKAENPVKAFPVYPDMIGINSGSGAYYTKTKSQLLIRNIITKIGLNTYDPKPHFYYRFFSWLEYIRFTKLKKFRV